MYPKPTYLKINENNLKDLKEIGDYFIKTHELAKNFPKKELTTYGQFAVALMYAKTYMEENNEF